MDECGRTSSGALLNGETTNNNEYLLSQTGNRRFWPLAVGKIKVEELRRDRLQLLGEAASFEADGESVVLDEKLWPAALAEQEKRRVIDPWEDILADIPETVPVWGQKRKDDDGGNEPDDQLRIIHHQDNEQRVASRDLLEHVLRLPPVQQKRFDAMRLSDVMRVLGWKRNPNGKVSIEGLQGPRLLAKGTDVAKADLKAESRPTKIEKCNGLKHLADLTDLADLTIGQARR